MPKITIDGREIELPSGLRINAIEAAKRAGVEIPHYCYHPGLSVVGSCRMCLIETGNRDPKTGEIKMQPKLVPGCTVPAADGLAIVTAGEKVRQARAMVEEDLLLRHPVDCPICDKAGECQLQDYYFKYGQASRRTDVRPFTSRKRDLGDVELFIDRCVMCSRCVRFCAEVSGTAELMVANRGAQEEIDVVPGFPLHNELSGNVVDLCPVGALADKDFLYQQRVWFMRRHRGVCTGCSAGCSIWIEENQDHIYRLKPRENPQVNKWWICNQGRFGYHHVHDERRLAVPRLRKDGTTVDLSWNGLPEELKSKLSATRSAGCPGRLGGLLSPFLGLEEAYLLAKLLRSIDPQAVLAMGPVPRVGEDEKFPGGFVISAEKAPNRRGVEEILGHFMHKVLSLEDFLKEIERGDGHHVPMVGGVWVSGGYKGPWIEESVAQRFERIPLLIVQDLFPSPLSQRATYELPAAAFAERDGSYMNRGERLQTSTLAVRPPWGVRAEGPLFWQMLGRKGLYNSRAVLDDVSREVLYFAPAAGPLPETGLDMKINKLADAGAPAAKTA
jgi:NADH-quinone oxidoreductase subunit G